MKQFELNDCGICTNPNKYGLDWRNEIKTMRCPDGKWVFGISYQLDTPDCEGGGFGAWKNDKNRYDTEREAAMAAIRTIEKRIAYRKIPRGDKRRAGIDACMTYVFDTFNQLTLF